MKSNLVFSANQLPLFLPESNWVTPTIPDLTGVREVAIDTETRDGGLSEGIGPGWATGNGHLCGVSVAWDGGSVYLPLKHPDSTTYDHIILGDFLKELYARTDLKLVFMNAPYDLGWLWREFNLMPPFDSGRIDDVGLMAVMVDENRPSGGYSLDGICQWQGLPGKDETVLREAGAAHGFDDPKALKGNLWQLPARFVGPYAEADATQTLAVAAQLRAIMNREKTTAAYQTEANLIPCCFEMRRRGVRIDIDRVQQGIAHFAELQKEILKELAIHLGRSEITLDQIRSSKWLEATCLDEGIDVPITKPTKDRDGQMKGGGRPSFTSNWMRKSDHWLPRLVNQADRLSEATNKFLKNYILEFEHKGRIHPSINQFRGEGGGTRSHRFSYSDPPLQQAPGKSMEELDDLGREIVSVFRGAFLPEDGELWCSPDYNSQEFRLIVHYAERSNLSRARDAGDRYRADPHMDFHQLVADMTGLSRWRAKQCNFAKAFGAGVAKFSTMSGMTLEDAKAVMQQYDNEMPFVHEEAELCKRLAVSRGYIRLIDDARSHFNLWERTWCGKQAWREGDNGTPSTLDACEARYPGEALRRAYTHKAMNRLIQGSAARQTKIAMLGMWREGIVPLLQMHDELDISCDGPEKGERAAEIMRDAVKLSIPVVVDMGYGISWGTAKKVKDPSGDIIYDASWNDASRLKRDGQWW